MTDIKSAPDLKPGNVPALERGAYAAENQQITAGVIMPRNHGELVELAQMMCKGGIALPEHFRDKPGVCVAIIRKAMRWEMDEWEVANQTYSVNNRLAYQAQLLAAVVKKWAPIKERVINPIYEGEGEKRTCSFLLHHRETGEEIHYKSPPIGPRLKADVKEPADTYVGIWPKNSPLWKSEPDQQLYYYSLRAMARRHFPDILMGAYDREEVMAMKDITPAAERRVDNMLNDDPPGETLEGEIMPKATTREEIIKRAHETVGMQTVSADGEAGDSNATAESRQAPADPPHDAETGELFDEPETVITPEVLAKNMISSIKGFTNKRHLEAYHAESQVAINGLPVELRKQVSKILSDRHIDLEEL